MATQTRHPTNPNRGCTSTLRKAARLYRIRAGERPMNMPNAVRYIFDNGLLRLEMTTKAYKEFLEEFPLSEYKAVRRCVTRIVLHPTKGWQVA